MPREAAASTRPYHGLMPAGSQLTLFHVRGIRIGVDYSWFLVLFLLIIYLSGFYRDVLGAGSSDSQPYVLAVVTALAFFGSILLHELGHAVVAIRNGIPISEITLWLFGGVARMTRDTDSPGTEFKVAVAGPAGHPGDRARLRRGRDRARRAGRVLAGAAVERGRRHLGRAGGAQPGSRASTCSSSSST